jgi:UDP-glucose 4-epimerase
MEETNAWKPYKTSANRSSQSTQSEWGSIFLRRTLTRQSMELSYPQTAGDAGAEVLFTYDDVLVTGGAGFIGSHTVDALLDREVRVWVLDDLSTGRLQNLRRWEKNRRFHFKHGTVTNYRTVESLAHRVDSVIHLAAIVSPNVSLRQPELVNRVNIDGTLNVLRATLKKGVKRVVFASSSSVYGNAKSTRISENTPLNPITPYGVSKLSAEKYCQVYHDTYGLEVVSLRYFNVYGPRQSANPYSGVIAFFATELLKKRRPVIYGNGGQTRDFVYVTDVARANALALQTRIGVGMALNVGTGRATAIKDLFRLLSTITGRQNIQPRFAGERPGDIRDSRANISRIKSHLDFCPEVNLPAGLKRLVDSLTAKKIQHLSSCD